MVERRVVLDATIRRTSISIPTHGPSCQTLVYDTSCWYCQQEIFVLQCSCGSAVLLDQIGKPWTKHVCAGIGGSGYSGWTAVDVLQAQGVPITADVMAKIFPDHEGNRRNLHQEDPTRKVDPERDGKRSMLAVVRALHRDTKRTENVEDLPEFGRKLLGLDPKVRYRQITLVNNGARPNESYTALVPDDDMRGLRLDAMVMVEMRGHVAGDYAEWIVTDIKLL